MWPETEFRVLYLHTIYFKTEDTISKPGAQYETQILPPQDPCDKHKKARKSI